MFPGTGQVVAISAENSSITLPAELFDDRNDSGVGDSGSGDGLDLLLLIFLLLLLLYSVCCFILLQKPLSTAARARVR